MSGSRTEVGMAKTDNAEQTTIEISGFSKELGNSMNKKLRHRSPTLAERCIFRVPKKLRRHKDDNVFDPIIVSIGPFHHHGDGLAEMEKIKWWYLNCLFDQYKLPPAKTLQHSAESIRTLSKRARGYYSESFKLNDSKFIEMMIVDGFFLIELFRKNALSPQPKDDPIFSSQWNLERLHHDLILLENQIPWFVLQKLYNLLPVPEQEKKTTLLQVLQQNDDHEQEKKTTLLQLFQQNDDHEQDNDTILPQLVLRFFNSMMLMDSPAQYTPRKGQEIKHILDLLHSCLLSQSKVMLPQKADDQKVPPVTDLLQAGVKFKAGASGDIFNIKFSNGEFEIPPILIKSNSESLFRNLIAYEQCDYNLTIQFTSYALFLDCLINTVKDVNVLYHENILRPGLSAEDMSLLFNKLYNDTLVHRCYYGGVSLEINKHYSRWVSSQLSRCREWIATLKRVYFRNPWKISSVLAAILILIFTGIQTVIAMLAYYNVPHF